MLYECNQKKCSSILLLYYNNQGCYSGGIIRRITYLFKDELFVYFTEGGTKQVFRNYNRIQKNWSVSWECNYYDWSAPRLSLFHFSLDLYSHQMISMDSCALLYLWSQVPAPVPSQPSWCHQLSLLLLSWFHRRCPSLSFQQLLWAPGSCQKSFASQGPTGASQWWHGKTTPRGDVQPMSDTHSCTLPGGKVHSEIINVSIFNLSGRKRGAKPPLLKQCL